MWLGTFQGEASPVPWLLRSALADLGDEAAGQGTAGPAWVACQHCVHVSPARSACPPQAVWPQTSWAPATPRAWPLPPARPAPAASASPRVMTGPAGLSRPARCPGGVLAAGVPPWARPTAPQQQTAPHLPRLCGSGHNTVEDGDFPRGHTAACGFVSARSQVGGYGARRWGGRERGMGARSHKARGHRDRSGGRAQLGQAPAPQLAGWRGPVALRLREERRPRPSRSAPRES